MDIALPDGFPARPHQEVPIVKHTTLALVFVALLFVLTVACAPAQENEPAADAPAVGQLTAAEAYAKWKADPQRVTILDVRSPEEYVFVGHPTMAINVPLMVVAYESDGDQRKFAMKPNPNFVAEVKEIVAETDTVLVTCRSGNRSPKAVDLLAKAGYKHLYDVVDGVEGGKVKDPNSIYNGQRKKDGWKNAGLPWTYDVDDAKMRLPEKAAAQ